VTFIKRKKVRKYKGVYIGNLVARLICAWGRNCGYLVTDIVTDIADIKGVIGVSKYP